MVKEVQRVRLLSQNSTLFVVVLLCAVLFNDRLLIAQLGSAKLEQTDHRIIKMDDAKFNDWLLRWEKKIIRETGQRYCQSEMGEEIGWLMMPFLKGFYYGYLVTVDTRWVDMLVNCTDAWIKRAVIEPDGHLGWPKIGAAGTDIDNLDDFRADSLLGEAMALRFVVLMSDTILKSPALSERYGAKAKNYVEFSEQIFNKWNERGAWRSTEGDGVITVVLPYGIDQNAGHWTGGYESRNALRNGFSHQDNKANLIACWLLAMYDATGKAVYRERAEKWFRLMKSRMRPKDDDTYEIWNYWQPAGAWDYKFLFVPKHWIGVHPKAGYYDIDVEAIVTAYEHGIIFNSEDIMRLARTALSEKRYWEALVPYNDEIQYIFEANHKPDSWHGLSATPWYLALQVQLQCGNQVSKSPDSYQLAGCRRTR